MARPVAFDAPAVRPGLARLSGSSVGPCKSCAQVTQEWPGDGALSGDNMLAHPCRENGSAFCNCYHLFPSIVFVDVFLF